MGNGEWGTGNTGWGMGNGERGTRDGEWGYGMGIESREREWEQGIQDGEWGNGNRECLGYECYSNTSTPSAPVMVSCILFSCSSKSHVIPNSPKGVLHVQC